MMKQTIEGRLINITDTHYITETQRGKQSWNKDYYRLSNDEFLTREETQVATRMVESGEITSIGAFLRNKIKNVIGNKQTSQRTRRRQA